MFQIGDKVRVIASVWDDHRNKDWFGWDGIVEQIVSEKDPNPYKFFVFFPKSRGKNRHYDFREWELEKLGQDPGQEKGEEMSDTRELLVFGDKTFRIKIPDDAKVTFAPFSPPSKGTGYAHNPERAVGTLRVYRGTKDNIVAVFSGVKGFRDMSLEYAEEVAREEGAVIWKSDKDGYQREEKVNKSSDWVEPVAAITAKKKN